MRRPKTDGPHPTRVIARHVAGHAYARSGNAHNPTPRVRWDVLGADGRIEVTKARLRDAKAFVRRYYPDAEIVTIGDPSNPTGITEGF